MLILSGRARYFRKMIGGTHEHLIVTGDTPLRIIMGWKVTARILDGSHDGERGVVVFK